MEKVIELTEEMQEVLAPFSARPHWGKLHTLQSKEIHALYDGEGGAVPQGFAQFKEMCKLHDPSGKFRSSPWAREVLGSNPGMGRF
jgi:xylitol oxidase